MWKDSTASLWCPWNLQVGCIYYCPSFIAVQLYKNQSKVGFCIGKGAFGCTAGCSHLRREHRLENQSAPQQVYTAGL